MPEVLGNSSRPVEPSPPREPGLCLCRRVFLGSCLFHCLYPRQVRGVMLRPFPSGTGLESVTPLTCFLISTVRGSTEFCSGSEPRLFAFGGFRILPGWRRMDAFLSIKSRRKEHAQLVHFKHPVLQDHSVPTTVHTLLLRSKHVISRTLDGTRYTLIRGVWHQPGHRCSAWWQVWNTDVQPLLWLRACSRLSLELGIHILLLAHHSCSANLAPGSSLGNAEMSVYSWQV